MRLHVAVEFSDAERRILDRASLAVGVGRSGEEREGAVRALRSLVEDLTPAHGERVLRALGEIGKAVNVVRREGSFEHWRELAGPDWPNPRVQEMAEVIVRARQDFLADLTDAGHLLAGVGRIVSAPPGEILLVEEAGEPEYRSDRRDEKPRRRKEKGCTS